MSDEIDVEVVEDDELDMEDMEVSDPVFPNDEVKDQLVLYLKGEYEDVVGSQERKDLEKDWAEWRRISMAKPKERVKDKPWAGAANVVTPFTFSNVNGVFAHLKSAIAEKRPRWQVTAGNDEYKDCARDLQLFLNELMLSTLHINITEKDEIIMFDGARMGTQFAEVPWVTKRTQFKRRTNDGPAEVVDKVVYDGPMIVPHRLEDVITRSHWGVQDAPYIGFVYEFTQQDLKTEEFNGFFEDVQRVFGFSAEQHENVSEERELVGINPDSYEDLVAPGTPYHIVKWYVRWDADEDGLAEDLIVWMEPSSGVILRSEWCELGVRPIGNGRYVAVPYMIYGLGVCAMLYRLQEEIDTMHNIGINSLHIASLQMYVTARGSGIGENEPFFPLKNIQVDDPSRDFMPIKFPSTGNETIVREQTAQQYGRTVTGISEGQLGMPDTTAKSGTSPTLQQFLAQQGNKILRSVIASFADFYGELGQYVVLQLVANSDRVMGGNAPLLQLLKNEEARENVRKVLRMDVEDIPQMFQFSVRTTEADKTDDARRQFLMMKHQLMSQYIQQAQQMVMMLDNPQMQQMENARTFTMKMYVALTRLMEETLGLFDVDDAGEYLPNVEKFELGLEIMEMMQAPQLAQARQQLKEARGEGQGTTGEAEDVGIYQPGYTAGENAAGDAGNQGGPPVAPGQGGGGNGGPTPQQPQPGVAGPR